MTLRRFTYISRVASTIANTDLRHIVGLAEVLHRRHNLSGVLAYTGPHFLQVIEGHAADVDWLLQEIRADSRHADMRVICDEVVSLRLFDRWYSLHVESPDLVDEIQEAHVDSTAGSAYADKLAQQLLSHLRSDDLMA